MSNPIASSVRRPAVFSTGALAELLGVPDWTIRRVVQRKMVPSVSRLREGGYCVWTQGNVAEVVEALKLAGYLAKDAPVPDLTVTDSTSAPIERAAMRPLPRSEVDDLRRRLEKLEAKNG